MFSPCPLGELHKGMSSATFLQCWSMEISLTPLWRRSRGPVCGVQPGDLAEVRVAADERGADGQRRSGDPQVVLVQSETLLLPGQLHVRVVVAGGFPHRLTGDAGEKRDRLGFELLPPLARGQSSQSIQDFSPDHRAEGDRVGLAQAGQTRVTAGCSRIRSLNAFVSNR